MSQVNTTTSPGHAELTDCKLVREIRVLSSHTSILVSTNKSILMINHGTYENLPVMDLMACRCTLCCETPGHYLPHTPREAALLCLEWLHKSCNLIFLLRFCLCFRSPPPRASDQLLRPRPDQGRGERHDQRGGHRLSDVSRPPVDTPGNPGGEVGCR